MVREAAGPDAAIGKEEETRIALLLPLVRWVRVAREGDWTGCKEREVG
jgi:hypothetical protein